jgi:hypothetical protein
MLKPSVATCFNPSCDSEFRRMGDGKLFVEPLRNLDRGHGRQVVWLCKECSREHSLQYDYARNEFVLGPNRPHGRHVA